MRKTAGKTGFSGKAKERHGSDRSPREGPSERLPSGMTAEEPFLLIDKMQTKDTKAENRFLMEGRSIKHISIQSGLIETMGYEPQNALLEIRLSNDGRVWQYRDVPEDVWYQLREDRHPDAYFRRYICGHYRESLLTDECGIPCIETRP